MKFPDASELTEEEKNLKVSFAEGDVYPYPGFMVDQPLEVMIHYANYCLQKNFSLQNVLDEKKEHYSVMLLYTSKKMPTIDSLEKEVSKLAEKITQVL